MFLLLGGIVVFVGLLEMAGVTSSIPGGWNIDLAIAVTGLGIACCYRGGRR